MQSSDVPTSWYELSTFVRRHLRLMVSCVVVGLLLALMWLTGRPTSYSATASVLVSPVPSFVSPSTVGRPPRAVTLDTDAALIKAPAVARSVGAAVNTDPRTAREAILVTAAPLTRVLRITYQAPSAAMAANGANAAADAFIDLRRKSLGALRINQINELSIRVADLREQFEVRTSDRVIIDQSDPMDGQIQQLTERLQDLKRARRVPAQVIGRAAPPRTRDPIDAEVPLTSGVMMGLLTATCIGYLVDRRRRPRGR